MKQASLVLLFGLLLLSGCIPAFQRGAPELHDIALFERNADGVQSGTLYGYFYGEEMKTTVRGAEVSLEKGSSEDVLSVGSALLVDAKPYVRTSLPPLNTPPVLVQSIPYATDVYVQTPEALRNVLYYDGERWFTLLDAAAAGFQGRVVPLERNAGLRGVGELTSEEAQVFQAYLEQQGPVVVALLPGASAQTRGENGLGDYKNTTLFVQRGVEALSAPPRNAVSSNVGWDVVAKGNQAMGSGESEAAIATSSYDLESIWSQAYGNYLELPALPNANFAGSSLTAFFLGTRMTGGYSVDVKDVAVTGKEAKVMLVVSQPTKNTMTTQALSNPWVLLQIGVPDLSRVDYIDAKTGQTLATARSALGK